MNQSKEKTGAAHQECPDLAKAGEHLGTKAKMSHQGKGGPVRIVRNGDRRKRIRNHVVQVLLAKKGNKESDQSTTPPLSVVDETTSHLHLSLGAP